VKSPRSCPYLLCMLASISLLPGCRMTNTWNEPDAYAPELPDAFPVQEGTTPVQTTWWELFEHQELNQLMERALTNNFTIQGSYERLLQAEATMRKRGADRMPELSLEASAAGGRRSAPDAAGRKDIEQGALGLGASYEVDLWGRVASQAHEAGELMEAAAADLQTARLSLASQLTLSYLELMATRASEDVVRAQISANKRMLELIDLRFRRSQATALDVLQQRSLLAQSEANLPPILSRETQLLTQLAILTGQAPSAAFRITGRELPDMPPTPRIGVPANLLIHRPDVAAAAARLKAAGWSATSARADRLPTLRLSADAAYSSNSSIANLFDDWFAQLAAGLVGPIIDGGQRKAELLRSEAVARERLANYRQTVITAVGEVTQALQNETHQTTLLAALNRQLDAATQTQKEATSRYQKGSESYLSVLQALTTRQQVERNTISAQFNQLALRVQLIRALGGQSPANHIEEEPIHE
jgi:multidrug efflux system outer membrane protein